MSRRAFALFALWAALTGGAAIVSACYPDNCLGEVKVYGREPGEGRMIDENTWESSPQDGKWLPYPRSRVWVFEIRELGDRRPEMILPYISPVEDPNKQPSNFTLGGGNLSEISAVDLNRVVVRNGTCADYFLRLVVVAAPRPPGIAPGDGGGDANADASVDGAASAEDASTDVRDGDAASDGGLDARL